MDIDTIKNRNYVVKKELERYEQLLIDAENKKKMMPFYRSEIKTLKKWLEEYKVCERCEGHGSYRYDDNNHDCELCNGTGAR